MDRRNFFRVGLTGAAAGLILPGRVVAAGSPMAGGVYYTSDAPGRWSKKVGGHLPNIETAQTDDGVIVNVVTAHEMDGYSHYIVKHVVLDSDYRFLGEHLFDPDREKTAASEISIGKYSGPVNVLSVCNKHDTWLNVAEV